MKYDTESTLKTDKQRKRIEYFIFPVWNILLGNQKLWKKFLLLFGVWWSAWEYKWNKILQANCWSHVFSLFLYTL